MLLLAVASGLPDLSPDLLRARSTAPDDTRLGDLAVPGRGLPPAAAGEQVRLAAWLDQAGTGGQDLRVDVLRPVAEDVRRFTFVVDPG